MSLTIKLIEHIVPSSGAGGRVPIQHPRFQIFIAVPQNSSPPPPRVGDRDTCTPHPYINNTFVSHGLSVVVYYIFTRMTALLVASTRLVLVRVGAI